VSAVIQDFIGKFPKPEDVKSHADEAIVNMKHFEDAIRKVKTSRDGRPMEKAPIPYYR
jgi:transitional endoplasmic reticulum ATPase